MAIRWTSYFDKHTKITLIFHTLIVGLRHRAEVLILQILKAYSSAVQSQKTVSSSKQILPFGFAGLPITLCSTTTTFVNIASIFVYYILFWNILIITVIIIIILLSARRFCTVNKQMYTKPLQLF